jgi:hypothetical protein
MIIALRRALGVELGDTLANASGVAGSILGRHQLGRHITCAIQR